MTTFEGQPLVVATKHGKERAIFPAFARVLGVTGPAQVNIDTDSLGTFCGEVPRMLSPLDAAKKKCRMAIEQSGCALAVASEGSFGPHPHYPIVTCAHELMVFYDARSDRFVVESELALNTNFSGCEVTSLKQLHEFARQALFPEHRLILRSGTDQITGMVKGIGNWPELDNVFSALMGQHGQAFVETDMRAHCNPTRMAHLAELAVKLAQRVAQVCNQCGAFGFGATNTVSGVPCGMCGAPTQLPLAEVHACDQCGFTSARPLPPPTFETAAYCDRCNP